MEKEGEKDTYEDLPSLRLVRNVGIWDDLLRIKFRNGSEITAEELVDMVNKKAQSLSPVTSSPARADTGSLSLDVSPIGTPSLDQDISKMSISPEVYNEDTFDTLAPMEAYRNQMLMLELPLCGDYMVDCMEDVTTDTTRMDLSPSFGGWWDYSGGMARRGHQESKITDFFLQGSRKGKTMKRKMKATSRTNGRKMPTGRTSTTNPEPEDCSFTHFPPQTWL